MDKRLKYKYDDLYELDYSTDEDIKEAILNTAVSAGIYAILRNDDNVIKGIKDRQLSKGVFSNIDKEYLIGVIRRNPKNYASVATLIRTMYPIAKNFIDENNGDEVLSNLFGFDVTEIRTNITAKEVFGKTNQKKM